MKKIIFSISLLLILFSSYAQLTPVTDEPVIVMATFTQREAG